MTNRLRTVIVWSYLIFTILSFFGLVALAVLEAHARWTLNQNFSYLDGNGLLGLTILVAAQMIGLAWISRPHN